MRGKFDQKVVRLNLFSAVLLFPDKTTLPRIVFLPTQVCKLVMAHKKIAKSNKMQGESRPVMDLHSIRMFSKSISETFTIVKQK